MHFLAVVGGDYGGKKVGQGVLLRRADVQSRRPALFVGNCPQYFVERGFAFLGKNYYIGKRIHFGIHGYGVSPPVCERLHNDGCPSLRHKPEQPLLPRNGKYVFEFHSVWEKKVR